jgi:hypothetical protein
MHFIVFGKKLKCQEISCRIHTHNTIASRTRETHQKGILLNNPKKNGWHWFSRFFWKTLFDLYFSFRYCCQYNFVIIPVINCFYKWVVKAGYCLLSGSHDLEEEPRENGEVGSPIGRYLPKFWTWTSKIDKS